MSSVYLKEIFKFLLIIFIEVKLLFLLEIYNVKPSIFLIFLILNTLKRGNPMIGAAVGFSSGLLLDFFNADYLGLSSLTFSIIGFFSAYLGYQNEKLTKTQIFGFSFVMIFIHSFIYYFVKGFDLDKYHLVFMIIAPTICYTSLFQIVITYFLPHSKKRREI